MSVAKAVSKGSSDPSTKVGCVIVTEKYEPVSFGYNDFINGCDRKLMTFERPQKYMLIVHAEINALIAARRSIENCRVYVTHAPCPNCLRNLIQAGVSEIVYDSFDTNGKFMDDVNIEVTEILVKANKIIFRNINGENFLDKII
jgi:dCMP deaminase